MPERPSQQQLAAANAYESLFVPALFQEWAPRIADAARIGAGQRVLDVACGTGILARELLTRVGTGGAVAGLDPDPGMLAVAARLAPAVDWRQGVAEALPGPDCAFDAVVSQFGLMFFADRRGALRQMRRVLVPGGRMAVAVWDALERTPAYARAVELLERIAGRAAADALRAPFALGDAEVLARLVEDAGFAGVAVAAQRGRGRFPSVRVMVEADLRGWLPVLGVVLPEAQIERILTEAEEVLGAWVDEQGRVAFDSTALVVTATRPAG